MLKLLVSEWWAPPSAAGARFKIRGLTGVEYLDLVSTMESIDPKRIAPLIKQGQIQLTREIWDIYAKAVEDWQGVGGPENGAELPFDRAAMIKGVSLPVLKELISEIDARTAVSEDQEKNSLSQPRSPSTGAISTAQDASGASPASPDPGAP